MLFKGILYKNKRVYRLLTKIKLGKKSCVRYQLAAKFLLAGESVLDICAGIGDLKNYLPQNCYYETIEASPQFAKYLQKNKIKNNLLDISKSLDIVNKFDNVIMIISLYHFKNLSIDYLLQQFKGIAYKRVIIVEEVINTPSKKLPLRMSLAQKIGSLLTNYLCQTDYFKPTKLFDKKILEAYFNNHSYQIYNENDYYMVGVYEKQ